MTILMIMGQTRELSSNNSGQFNAIQAALKNCFQKQELFEEKQKEFELKLIAVEDHINDQITPTSVK